MFYEKYGGKTIIFARFIPIVRTFAPFVAGLGSMTYSKFVVFIIAGATAWVGIFAYGGYFFGNIEFVKHNFSVVIIAIICISMVPGLVGYFRHKSK
jgi:membrane-associated protein